MIFVRAFASWALRVAVCLSPSLLSAASSSISYGSPGGWSPPAPPPPPEPLRVLAPPPPGPDQVAQQLGQAAAGGGEAARAPLLQALAQMGFTVARANGRVLQPPAPGRDNGLILLQEEIDLALGRSAQEQPAVHLISLARVWSTPFPDEDPELAVLALLTDLRLAALSRRPENRFTAHFLFGISAARGTRLDLPPQNYQGPLAEEDALPPGAPVMEQRRQAAIAAVNRDAARGKLPPWTGAEHPWLGQSAANPATPPGTDSARIMGSRTAKMQAELEGPTRRLADPSLSAAERRDLQQEREIRQAYWERRFKADTAAAYAGMMRQQAEALQDLPPPLRAMAEAQMRQAGGGVPPAEPFLAEHRDHPLTVLQVLILSRLLCGALAEQLDAGAGGTALTPPPRALAGLPGLELFSLPPLFAQAGPGTISSVWGGLKTTAAGVKSAYDFAMSPGEKILDHVVENWDEHGATRVEKLGLARAIFGAVTSWVRIFLMIATQDLEIKVERDELTRRKDRQPGEQREVRCTVKIDLDPAKIKIFEDINAVTSKLYGFSLNPPPAGPIADAGVDFDLTRGSGFTKVSDGRGGFRFSDEENLVRFQEGVKFRRLVTNSAGIVQTRIEGVPRKEALPENAARWPRSAAVAVAVTLKRNSFRRDMMELSGAASGGGAPSPGGSAAAPGIGLIVQISNFVTEMLERTPLFFQKGKAFVVNDWKPPQWEGRFSFSAQGNGSWRESSPKDGDTTMHWRLTRQAGGRLDAYARPGALEIPLLVRARNELYSINEFSQAQSKESVDRYDANGPIPKYIPELGGLLESRAYVSGEGKLELNPEAGTYRLTFEPRISAPVYISISGERKGRPLPIRQSEDTMDPIKDLNLPPLVFNGTYDPASGRITASLATRTTAYLPFVRPFPVDVDLKIELWTSEAGEP